MGRKSSMFLFVCLSVTLLKDGDCERHFTKALKFGNDRGIALYSGMFVDVRPRSTLFLQHWAEPQQNDKVEKQQNLGIFAPQWRHSKPIEVKFGG